MTTIGLKFTVYLVVIVSMLESIQAHLYDPDTQSAANEFISSRRNLIEKSQSGRDCEKCILLNKNVCWQFKGTSMSNTRSNLYKWQTSYCCGSSDSQCNSLEFCSKGVSSSLKHFGCPVDDRKCPSLTDSNVVLTRAGKSGAKSKREQWNSIYHRYDSHCKYKISVDSARIKIDPDKYDSSYVIEISSKLSRVSAKLIYLKDGKLNSKTGYKLLRAGKSYTIRNPQPNDQLWIQYEPDTLKAGYVGFKTYIIQTKLSPEEIAIREEAERQRQIEEQKRQEEEQIRKIEEQKRLEEERKRIEEEKKIKLEEERRIAQEKEKQRQEQKKIEEENARLQKAIEEAEKKIKEQQEIARKAEEERKKQELEQQEEQKRLEEEEKLRQERLKQQEETKKQQEELQKLQKEREQKEADLKRLQEESDRLEEERKKNEAEKKRIQEEEKKNQEEQDNADQADEAQQIDEADNTNEDDESPGEEDQTDEETTQDGDNQEVKEKTDSKPKPPTKIIYKNPDGTTQIIEDAQVDENGQITIIVESKPNDKTEAVVVAKDQNEDFTYPLVIGMLASALVTIIIMLIGKKYLFKPSPEPEELKKRDRRLSTQNEEVALNQFQVNNSSKDSYASHVGLLNNPKVNLRAVLGGKVNLADIQGQNDDVYQQSVNVKSLLEKLGLNDQDINDELHKEILLYIKLRNGGLDQTPRKELQSMGIDEDKIEKVRGYVERIARQQESVKFSQNGDIENQGAIPRITLQDLERSEVQSQSEYLNQMQNIYFNKSNVSRAKTANAGQSISSDHKSQVISINNEADQQTAIKRKTTPNGFNLGAMLMNKNSTIKINPSDQDQLQLQSAVKGKSIKKYGARNSSNKKFLTADGTHADNTAQPLDTMENDDFQNSIEKKNKNIRGSQSRSNREQIGAGVLESSLQEFYETNRNFNRGLDQRKKSTKVPSENPYNVAKVDVNSQSSREGSDGRLSIKLTNKPTTNMDTSQYDEIRRVYQDQDDALPNQQNSSLEDTQLGVNDTRDQINSSLIMNKKDHPQKNSGVTSDDDDQKITTQNSMPQSVENEIKMIDVQDDNMQIEAQQSFKELTQVNESSHEDLNASGHFQRTQEPVLTDIHDSHQFSYLSNQQQIQMSIDQKSIDDKKKTPKKQNTFLYKGENLVQNTEANDFVLHSEPFNTDELQFNKVKTANHESPNVETQDSNFVDQVKKAMVISPMKLNPKTENEDNKPINFIHQQNQNDELVRVVSFARTGLQDPNQQSPMTPGAFDDLRNQLSQNLVSREMQETPYLGQKKHLGYTSTAKKDDQDTLTKNLLEDTPSEQSPPKKYSVQSSIEKKNNFQNVAHDVQPIMEEVENEELRSPGRSPPIQGKKSHANLKFSMHALKQSSIHSSQKSNKNSPTKSSRQKTPELKAKKSPVPKKPAQKTQQNNTPTQNSEYNPSSPSKQQEQKKEIVGLMRSTFTSMAKVSELFNKVEELDSPTNADVLPSTDIFVKGKQIGDLSDQLSSSEEDEVLRDLISQKSKLEDKMRQSSYSPMKQGSVFDLAHGEVTAQFQSPIVNHQNTNETVNVDSKLRFDTDEELKQNETIVNKDPKPSRSKRSTTIGPEKQLNKQKLSEKKIKMKSIEQTLNNGIRERFTLALDEVGKKSLRPLPDPKPQEVNPQIVKDLEKENDKNVKRSDQILNKFMMDKDRRQSKKSSIPNATQSQWDKGSYYGGKSLKSQTMSNWDQKFKVDRKSGISGVSIENMKKTTQSYMKRMQSNQRSEDDQSIQSGQDSMQTHEVRDSTKLNSYNLGKGIAGELGQTHGAAFNSQEQRNQNFQSLYQVENKQPLGGFMGDSGLQNTILKKYKDYSNNMVQPDSHRPMTQGGVHKASVQQYASGAVIGQYQPPNMAPKKTSTQKNITTQLGSSFNITNILQKELECDSQDAESYSPTRQQNLMGRGNKTSGRRGINYAKANIQDKFEKDYKTELGKSDTGANQSTQRMSNGQPAGYKTQGEKGEMATLAEQDSKKSTNYEISKQFVKAQFQKQQRLIEAKNPNLTSAQNILTHLSNNASKNSANNTETKFNDVGIKGADGKTGQGAHNLKRKVTMKNKKDLNKTGGMRAIGQGLVFNPAKGQELSNVHINNSQARTHNNSYVQKTGDQRAKSQFTDHGASGLRNGDQVSQMISTPNILGSKASRLTGSNIGAQIINQQKQVSSSFEGLGFSPQKAGSIEDGKSDLKSFYNDGV